MSTPVLTRGHGATTTAPHRWLARLGVPVGYLVLALVYNGHVVAGFPHRIQPGADGILFAWYLAWTKYSVLHLHNPFFSHAMNAPIGFNVTWNTWVPLLGLLCMPLVATVGPFTTVAILLVISPAISGASLYWVLRRIFRRVAAPALAGLLYGFGPWAIGQNDHLHLLFTPLVPLIGLLLYRLMRADSGSARRQGVQLGFLVAAQFLISGEVVALVAVVGVVAVLALVLTRPVRTGSWIKPMTVGLGVAAAVAAVLVSAPLAYQVLGHDHLTKANINSTQSADLASFIHPGPLQLWASQANLLASTHYPANSAESTAYLGWPLMILLAISCGWLLYQRDAFARWWLLTIVVTAALSLGAKVRKDGVVLAHGPWSLGKRLPFINSLLPARFSLLTALLTGLLLTYILCRLHGRRYAAAILVTAACLLPLVPRLPTKAWKVQDTPAFFTSSDITAIPAGSNVVVLPFSEVPDVSAMVWQIRANFRLNLVGGYSEFKAADGSSTPDPFQPTAVRTIEAAGRAGANISAEQIVAAQQSWRASGLRYLAVAMHFQPRAAAVVAVAAEVTGCAPILTGGVTLCVTPGS